jgi:hypothetical protein
VLRLDDGHIQFGCDPRWAVRLDDLEPAEVAVFLHAEHGADVPAEPPDGSSTGRWEALVDNLCTAGLLDAQHPRPPLRAGQADAIAWGVLDAHTPGRVAARQRRTVAVTGLGPTGLGIAVALAAAGVGTVLLEDRGVVDITDVGVCGYRLADVGSARASVAARLVHEVSSAASVTGFEEPDMVVLVDTEVADCVRAAAWVAGGVPHLSVVVSLGRSVVGPLVAASGGPCLRCVELHRAEADPWYPQVIAALADHRPVAEVGVLAGAGANLAAAMVLGWLDGDHRPVPVSTELTVPDLLPRTTTWRAHPACACHQIGSLHP